MTFLDSQGVRFVGGGFDPPGRYKMFTILVNKYEDERQTIPS
jgi:hypothetical protein